MLVLSLLSIAYLGEYLYLKGAQKEVNVIFFKVNAGRKDHESMVRKEHVLGLIKQRGMLTLSYLIDIKMMSYGDTTKIVCYGVQTYSPHVTQSNMQRFLENLD
jgi:hypothetical protein